MFKLKCSLTEANLIFFLEQENFAVSRVHSYYPKLFLFERQYPFSEHNIMLSDPWPFRSLRL